MLLTRHVNAKISHRARSVEVLLTYASRLFHQEEQALDVQDEPSKFPPRRTHHRRARTIYRYLFIDQEKNMIL